MKTTLVFLALWFSLIAYVQAEPQSFSSMETRTNLVELYPPVACNSLPAEHFISLANVSIDTFTLCSE